MVYADKFQELLRSQGIEKEWHVQGKLQVILDNLYAQKKVEPMIVVLPNGRAMKDDWAVGNIYDSLKVAAFATFEKDLISDLIPYIEKSYPVFADREHRAIAGLSMFQKFHQGSL
ncbi:alpha/beta hydrolase-fold protein [Labilibaculum sp. K2S]|uniref:alpha/beta hydrolase n=1 Tax=Labilibaculum sp. K2S TaxID=3056386 RepID=UPI0025A3B3E9|nr:alpha/beta hydrolase-fold protein [Labilibaculum sp. K2S]MDM8161521.1 alpha/beta hydrolase-fold protein [Labilibaculum sp. K2S]